VRRGRKMLCPEREENMARILSGKETASFINKRTSDTVRRLKERGIVPTLHILRVGENPADLSYERSAEKKCRGMEMEVEKTVFPEDVSGEAVLKKIRQLNEDKHVNGVLLFRPLPENLDADKIVNTLDPSKDVDSMTNLSLAGVFAGKKLGFPPCTAQACMEILNYYGIDCRGKKAVVVGRSLIVGKPVSMLLLGQDATVTVCHSRTVDLPSITRCADILIAAVGRAGMIGAEHVSEGQIVLDVGINSKPGGGICGDVDFEAVSPIAGFITPVPGGVGAVTTSVLLSHVARAAERHNGLE